MAYNNGGKKGLGEKKKNGSRERREKRKKE